MPNTENEQAPQRNEYPTDEDWIDAQCKYGEREIARQKQQKQQEQQEQEKQRKP